MVDYGKGKIYKIVVNNTEDEYRPYIGSTTNEYLSKRFVEHRSKYKKYKNGTNKSVVTSFTLFDKYGVENCEIVLIENYPCATKDELRARERYWFDNIENCNKCRPMKMDADKSEVHKEQYQRHLKLHPDANKKHYQRKLELNPNLNQKTYQRKLELYPDLCKKQYQKRLELHPDLCKKQYQRALELHPEYLERHNCECGGHYTGLKKSRHEKSKKHLNYIATIATQQEV
jgi:hypothetical protein